MRLLTNRGAGTGLISAATAERARGIVQSFGVPITARHGLAGELFKVFGDRSGRMPSGIFVTRVAARFNLGPTVQSSGALAGRSPNRLSSSSRCPIGSRSWLIPVAIVGVKFPSSRGAIRRRSTWGTRGLRSPFLFWLYISVVVVDIGSAATSQV